MGIITFIEQYGLAVMFLWAAALGVVFGLFYDVFRILRRALRGADRGPVAFVLIFLQDIVFFVAAAAVSAIFFYKFNSGRIRMSGIAFMLAGFTAYYFTLGRLVMLAADAVIAFIRYLLRLIFKFICFLLSPIVKFLAFAAASARRLVRLISLRLYTRAALGRYNKLLYK